MGSERSSPKGASGLLAYSFFVSYLSPFPFIRTCSMFSTVPSSFISGVERFEGKGVAGVHREKDTQRSGGFITHQSEG